MLLFFLSLCSGLDEIRELLSEIVIARSSKVSRRREVSKRKIQPNLRLIENLNRYVENFILFQETTRKMKKSLSHQMCV